MALMSTRLPGLIVLLLLFVNLCKLASCAPYWGTVSRDNCIKPGFRKYYARLWDIEGEWGPACETTPAFVQNVYFPAPSRCIDKGISGEWGEFFLRERSCDPWWHQINNYQCERESFHKYSSWLEHIEGSWDGWCVQTPAVVRGIFFSRPTNCYYSWFHEWADFKVPDICCSQRGHVELSIKSTGATKQLHRYDSELNGYMGLCVAPRSFVHWLELIHDAVELWRERERQTCSWPRAGADVVAPTGIINSNSRTDISDSKCILKVFETWRRRLGRSDDEDECESDEEMPPFPDVSDQVTDMAGAVAEFGERIIRTVRLLPYLFRTAFYTIVDVSLADVIVTGFHATIRTRVMPGPVSEPYLTLEARVPDPSVPNSLFPAMLVPTTPAHVILGSGGLFPVGSYAIIHVGQTPTASVICTARFTGCTFAIGWDRINRVLYMGHAQLGGNDATQSRDSLSNYMRGRGGFENVELDRENDIYFFGGDDMYYSYDTQRANVVGFIYETHVEMLFQVTNYDDEIIKSWIIFYCADDENI